MKKRILFCFAASLIIFINAEPWEGAAAVAPGNELPVTGYYIATDSFPGNTVVDITNIETGKSVRVMVANRLGKSDLLAIVSRQAAELIGMRAGSVTSIRMIQVTEPFASTDLSKRLASGIPAYDSGNTLAEELYSKDTYRPAPRSEPEAPAAKTPPSYVLEPEWRTRDVIVDLLPYGGLPAVEVLPEKKPVEVVEAQPEEEEPEEIVEAEEIEEAEEIVEAPLEEEEELVEIVEETEEVEETVEIVETEESEEFEEIVEALPEEVEEPVEIVEAGEIEEIVEEIYEKESPLVLVRAEERPPESSYGINPEDIISGIKLPETEEAIEKPVEEKPPQIVVAEQMFSVPRITELNRGWYYVQIASDKSPQNIDNILKQITQNYKDFLKFKPAVFKKEGDNWYRILLGAAFRQNERPLNQGESSAILQLFKSIGYANSFVITPEIAQKQGYITGNVR